MLPERTIVGNLEEFSIFVFDLLKLYGALVDIEDSPGILFAADITTELPFLMEQNLEHTQELCWTSMECWLCIPGKKLMEFPSCG